MVDSSALPWLKRRVDEQHLGPLLMVLEVDCVGLMTLEIRHVSKRPSLTVQPTCCLKHSDC